MHAVCISMCAATQRESPIDFGLCMGGKGHHTKHMGIPEPIFLWTVMYYTRVTCTSGRDAPSLLLMHPLSLTLYGVCA